MKVILFLLLFMTSPIFAVQEYMSAESTNPVANNVVNNPTPNVATQAPQSPASTPPIQSSPPIYVTPPAPATPSQLSLNNAPTVATAAAAPGDVTYSANDQQEWFKGCMTAQKDQRVTKYAQEYCQCSWDRISTSIPPKNLISTDPKMVETTNGLLRMISSECVILVLANHGEIT